MTDVVEIKDMSQLITAMGGAVKLDDMTDVTLTTPASGQVLEYNGTKWVNASILLVPVPVEAEAGYVLTAKADGTVEWVDPTAEVSTSKKKKA